MKAERSRYAAGLLRISAIALIPALISSCSSTADPAFGMLSPGLAPVGETAGDTTQIASDSEPTVTLPDTVAYLPKTKTGEPISPIVAPAEPAPAAATAETAALPTADTAAPAAAMQTADAAKPTQDTGFYVTATDPAATAEPISAKKRSFLSSLFGTTPAAAAPLVEPARPPKPLVEPASSAKPLVQLASVAPVKSQPVSAVIGDEERDLNPLPGVRQTMLFEIKRKSGIDDDSDVDLHEGDEDGSYQVAYAPGLARLAPNGLLKQTDNVDISCLKPSLVRMLKTVEARYGKKMIVTSGYRNKERNRRARGAKNSLHMYCAAADVQVPGVSKWELAKFVRSMPGRGGVGTYCHTESVHIDVGPERDWNWRCRRRKA
ncbi:MAG TPA: YcbK family protein [Rhizobiaceae bacterium]|nr:YcbK family protein [Rhizobiaceae bacterium]